MGTVVNKINIGRIIHEELKSQRRSVAWLAEQIPYDRSYMYRILKKQTINFELLSRISNILNVNFFNYYTSNYKSVK